MLNNTIPKIIHFVWVGGKELSESAKKNVAEWKRICPDYEIKLWNENNFDVYECDYVREAYEAKKYAFVSDYIRLKALYEYGGIYLDTDVELIKPFDSLLGYRTVLGFEDTTVLSTAIVMCAPKEKWVKDLLKYYQSAHFKKKRGYDTLPNPLIFTQYFHEYMGLKINGNDQTLSDGKIFIGKRTLFSGKSYFTGKIKTDEETVAIHMFDGSWVDKKSFGNSALKALIAIFRERGILFFKRIGLAFIYASRKKQLQRAITD
ncbi:MAG: glycosyltransferase family 32 protein [Candidatus Coproplasma sp.]